MAEPVERQPDESPERPARHLRSAPADVSGDIVISLPGRRVQPAAPGLARRALAWLVRNAVDIVALAATLAAAGALHAVGMANYPAFVDDEGTYVSQAWAVDKLHALAPYTYWYDHPPLGWLFMAAWGKVAPVFGADQSAIAGFRTFMFVLFLASAGFVYLIARRLGMRRPFAVLAVLLFSLSPLAVHYQRMALLDNIGAFWLLAALLLALTPARRLASYAGAGVCLAAAVLTKETYLLFAPAVVVAVWQTSRTSSRRFAIGVFATLFVLVASFYPLFALLRGEFLQGRGHTSLMYGITYQLTRPGTGSVFSATSPTRSIVDSWLATDPIVLTLGVLLLPLALIVRRARPAALGLLVPVLVLARPGGYVPGMFVIGMLPFAALVLAFAPDWLWQSGRAARVWRWRGRAASPADRAGMNLYRTGAASRHRLLELVPTALTVAVVGGLLLAAVPRWLPADRSAMTAAPGTPTRQAVAWLAAHASHRAYLLVDDSVWTDLVDRGFRPSHTIWYSKLDFDPTLGGVRWNRFNYAVRSNQVPLSKWGPNARSVWRHGVTVATFRYGSVWVKIRRLARTTSVASSARGSSASGG